MPLLFTINRADNDFFASADAGPDFFVARRVPYENNIGLANIVKHSKLEKLFYKAGDYTGQHGFWAEFIEPTAICEGRSFLTLNTYDRARFTFGFAQFAAHVPDGDFVKFFRAMLGLAQANAYFPHVFVKDGRIHRTGDGGSAVILETDKTTKPLMLYLNPTLGDVEDAEVIAAAKFIHWTSTTVAARDLQVAHMAAAFMSLMRRAEKRIAMTDRPAAQCCVIADILHQGRGGAMTWALIDAAVKSTKPLAALLEIGSPKWDGRLKTLADAIVKNAAIQLKRWDAAAHDFV